LDLSWNNLSGINGGKIIKSLALSSIVKLNFSYNLLGVK